MSLYTKLTGFLLALALAVTDATDARAATDADFSALGAIEMELDEIDHLLDSVSELRDWNRDGLNARIDIRAAKVLERLNRRAGQLLRDPETEMQLRGVLVQLMERGLALAMQRERYLEARAAQERILIPKFENSAQADIARVFIDDLLSQRRDYFNVFVEQLEVRRAAGMETESLLSAARQRITVPMEYLAGQVSLDAMSLRQLRVQLQEAPLDQDLQDAYGLLQAKQRRNLSQLDSVINLAERLGVAVAEQRSLLIRERGEVAVELLRVDVFGMLWAEQFSNLRQGFVRQGPDTLFQALVFLLIMLATWTVARIMRRLVAQLTKHQRLGLSVLIRESLKTLTSVAIVVAGTIIALVTVGVSMGPIFAGLGVLGILTGLAIQDSLGNLAAGVMILFTKPFDIDDHVEVAGANGLVKRMNWFATTITTFDNQVLVVPNRRIWDDTIRNHTASFVRRVDIKVNFSYSEDPDRVQQVLLDIVSEHPHVLETPKPEVHLVGMEDSALAMVVKPWVKTEHHWPTLWELNRLIKKRFDTEGIEIPFPQRVVTLQSRDGAPLPLQPLGGGQQAQEEPSNT